MATFAELANITGRWVLITGATGHLGYAISQLLAEMGANLLLIDRDSQKLSRIGSQLNKSYAVEVNFFTVDLENEADRVTLIEDVKRSTPQLDVLINNAAFVGETNIEGWAEIFEEQKLKSWRRGIEVNLTAAFHLCQGFASMLSQKNGSIINIGSIYAELGPDWRLYKGTEMANPAAYAASKGGLIQVTRWLATTLAPNVRVNAISPGGIERGQPKSFVRRYQERTPLARMATEQDLLGAVAYLASDLSSYVTGQNLHVDGGWGIW